MNKKTIISATDKTIRKLKILSKKKKGVKGGMMVMVKKLSSKARRLAVTKKGNDLYKNKKTVISATDNTILKLKVLAKKKEGARGKLVITAKKLAVFAKEKETVRHKLEITAKEKESVRRRLVVTAKEKESIRSKLEVTAKKLASTAIEKESVRKKLVVVAKQLAMFAREKEDIRKNLAVTAKEKENVRRKLAVIAKELKLKAKQLAMFAREKEDIRKNLAVTAKEKESIRRKLEVTAKKLASTATEKESIRRRLEVTAGQLKESYATEREITRKAAVATQNVLEDLRAEKTKVEIARVKEEALLESIGDGVIAVDKNQKIILMNHAAEQLLGWSAKQVIGKLVSEVWKVLDEKGNQISEEKRPISVALEGEITITTTTTTTTTTTGSSFFYTRKNGTNFPVALAVTPVIAENKIIGAIDVFRDVSKEKEIDKIKTEFVSLASHQLRTPLTTISWYTEMILNGDVGQVTPKQKNYLEEIYRGNRQMIELVNTLLDVSRIELGTFKAESKQTDIIALVRSALDGQKPKIEQKKLIITENFGKNISAILTDSNLLRVVFQNLLSNAVEYTPIGGKIDFKVSRNKESLLVKISDTGYGIPKNQQDKIFTKFFRADNIINKDSNGTGLGLYIVKSIVENSGGEIWFESEENKGTTFYVTLPLDKVKNKKDIK